MNDSLKNAYIALDEVLDQISIEKLKEIVEEIDNMEPKSKFALCPALSDDKERGDANFMSH